MGDESRDRPFVLQWRSAVLNSALPASTKLCLLILAEFADKDGTNCWPAIELVASKATVNEKTVRRAMDQAEPAGWIRRSHRGTKRGWRLFEYALLIPNGADIMPARQANGAGTESTRQGSTSGHSVHDVRTLSPHGAGTESTDLGITYPVTQEEKKPPAPRSTKREKKQTYDEWVQAKPVGEVLIPADHAVFKYAEDVGIPEEFLYLAWEAFQYRYRGRDKRYSSWRRVFLDHIKNNWLNVWRIDQATGRYVLTQVGLQLQREVKAQDAAA